ncbi:MAG: CRISPR system precrRNA processing endoribonuclease RAMP protein Cas6 [Desulfurococcaceae archaeon]|nr:CRISPR system precrRNA processing endoribonuclease RAMP protein Cas6 [Desulfurococcaceae archaeon]
MPLHVFRVSAVVRESVPLVAWSGSFLASIVKNLMSSDEVGCGFSLSPLQVVSGKGLRVVLSGFVGDSDGVVLDAGSRVLFRLTSFCRNFPSHFLTSLGNGVVGPFTVQSIDYEFIDVFPGGRAEDFINFIDVDSKGVVEVFFYPTILVFRGWRVLYPSPQRIVFNLLKLATGLLNLDPRLAKRRARVLSRNIELIKDCTEVVGIGIGRGRVVKAFMGRALFGVTGLENLRDFVDLLKFGSLVGVGKSRGIGFGFYRFRVLPPRSRKTSRADEGG